MRLFTFVWCDVRHLCDMVGPSGASHSETALQILTLFVRLLMSSVMHRCFDDMTLFRSRVTHANGAMTWYAVTVVA